MQQSTETLANPGEFIGAIGVVVSIGYLAIQIRHSTKAVRGSSYHQAAEQTWSAGVALQQCPELAASSVKAADSKLLAPEELLRLWALDAAVIFGFENMLRLQEEGLVDADVWRNVLDNSLAYLASPRIRGVLRERPGPLSARLLTEVEARANVLDIDLNGWADPSRESR